MVDSQAQPHRPFCFLAQEALGFPSFHLDVHRRDSALQGQRAPPARPSQASSLGARSPKILGWPSHSEPALRILHVFSHLTPFNPVWQMLIPSVSQMRKRAPGAEERPAEEGAPHAARAPPALRALCTERASPPGAVWKAAHCVVSALGSLLMASGSRGGRCLHSMLGVRGMCLSCDLLPTRSSRASSSLSRTPSSGDFSGTYPGCT